MGCHFPQIFHHPKGSEKIPGVSQKPFERPGICGTGLYDRCIAHRKIFQRLRTEYVSRIRYGHKEKIQDIDPYRILRNYIHFTYNRLDEENKFIDSPDRKFRCMNTGLLTVYNQEIVAIFSENDRKGKQP